MKITTAPLSLSEAFNRFFNRQDRFLLIASFIGLLALVLFSPRQTHIQQLNSRITETDAEQIATDFINGLGYNLESYRATIVFKKRHRDLNQLRVDFSEKELQDEYINRPHLSIPLYYISVNFFPIDARSLNLSDLYRTISSGKDMVAEEFVNPNQSPTMSVGMSLSGEVYNFQTTGQRRYVSQKLNRDVILPYLGENLPDTLRPDQISFRKPADTFDENMDGTPEQIQHQIERKSISGLARHHLNQTRWKDTKVVFDSSAVTFDEDFFIGSARFTSEDVVFDRKIRIRVDVDAAGNLHHLSQEYIANDGVQLPDIARKQSETYGTAVIVIMVLLAIVVLIRRFGRGLIDTSPSKIDAIVGGLALLVFISLNSTGKFARGEPSGTIDLLGPIFAVIFAGVGGFILIFLISVYASSISQEVWPQKLKQLNLLRKGYIINQPLGMTFIRSVLYGLIVGGIYVMYTGFIPHNGLIWTDEYVFYTDQTTLSSVHLLSSSIFGAIFFLFNFILGLNTLIFRKFRKGWVSILIIMSLWTIGGFITFEIINFWYNLPLVMIVGLFVGALFWYHGPITAILSFVLFELFVVSISGLWVTSTPDFWNMIVLIAVPAGFLFIGLRGIKSNTTSEELPDYIPSYLIELANRERMVRELEIARQVQLSFLPEKTPIYDGIQLSADCHPASEVGGDYYDFLPTSDGRLGLVIGDVSGKGIQAAFYMTLIKGFTQSLSDEMADPGNFLGRVNKLFYRNAKRGTFISMIYGVLDIKKKKFRFSRAGHNPLILVRGASKEVEMVKSDGLAIGLINDSRFEQSLNDVEIDLQPGDMIIMYTDGYTEAMNYGKELYGEERLLEIIRLNAGCSAEEMLQFINNDVSTFTGGSSQSDDMTIIIAKLSD